MVEVSSVNFKDFVATYKDRVYGKLCEYMPTGEPKIFNESMVRCYVDRKGQYRRPSYVLLWSKLYGGSIDDAVLPAAAQQASEDYFLMHDDWMDGNSVRRGGPAAHVMYDPAYAINAGSVVHMIAWKIAKEACDALGGERGKRYFAKFYDIMLVTHQGQYLDIRLTKEVKDITRFTLEEYYASIHAKSAYYSVYGPMQCGAIIAGADESVVERIPEYGTPCGNAFQIKDDILDCSSTTEALGKSIGTDVREGTKTLILWHAVHNASSNTLEKLKAIYSKGRSEKTDGEVKFVLDTFKEMGSIAYAQKEADRLVAEASSRFEALTRGVPESQFKAIARDGIGVTAKRNV
jgi:geranylgeranyl pyrophosphate synthase